MSEIHPHLSENEPLSSFFIRESSAFVRFPSAITIILVIKYDDNGWGDINRKMDAWTIKSKFRAEVAKMALKWLKKAFDRWDFEIISVDVHKS